MRDAKWKTRFVRTIRIRPLPTLVLAHRQSVWRKQRMPSKRRSNFPAWTRKISRSAWITTSWSFLVKKRPRARRRKGLARRRRLRLTDRSMSLPFEPEDGAVDAHFDKGVLHLRVKKPTKSRKTAKTIISRQAPKPGTAPQGRILRRRKSRRLESINLFEILDLSVALEMRSIMIARAASTWCTSHFADCRIAVLALLANEIRCCHIGRRCLERHLSGSAAHRCLHARREALLAYCRRCDDDPVWVSPGIVLSCQRRAWQAPSGCLDVRRRPTVLLAMSY